MEAVIIRKPDGTIITKLKMWSILVPSGFMRDFFRMKEKPKEPEDPDPPKKEPIEKKPDKELPKGKEPDKLERDEKGHFMRPKGKPGRPPKLLDKVTEPFKEDDKPVVPIRKYGKKFT